MANALGTLFQNIASAIRAKTGETGTMKPAEFPEKIAAIETGGGGGGTGGGDIELLEDMEIELALSAGNQSIAAPDGYAVKSAIILKPSTLIPSNIKTGVTIAGVAGTLDATEAPKLAFYGIKASGSLFTITERVTTFRGPGDLNVAYFHNLENPETVGIAALPYDGIYTPGCQWDYVNGHWVYDFCVGVNETFQIAHNGTIPSWEVIDVTMASNSSKELIVLSYEDSTYLEFKGNHWGNGTLRLFDSNGTIATYKIIVA